MVLACPYKPTYLFLLDVFLKVRPPIDLQRLLHEGSVGAEGRRDPEGRDGVVLHGRAHKRADERVPVNDRFDLACSRPDLGRWSSGIRQTRKQKF